MIFVIVVKINICLFEKLSTCLFLFLFCLHFQLYAILGISIFLTIKMFKQYLSV